LKRLPSKKEWGKFCEHQIRLETRQEDNNLESWENTNAVTIPRCAFLTVVSGCMFEEFMITTFPSTVPLQIEQTWQVKFDLVPTMKNDKVSCST